MSLYLTEAEKTSELLLWQVLEKKIAELDQEIERRCKLFSADPFMMGNHTAREKFQEEEIKPLGDKVRLFRKRQQVIEKDFNL